MKMTLKQKVLAISGVLVLTALIPGMASAGTGGTEFDTAYNMLADWLKGGLGRLFALALFATGIAAGVMKQSLMAAIVGIGAALAVTYGPDILGGIVAAAI